MRGFIKRVPAVLPRVFLVLLTLALSRVAGAQDDDGDLIEINEAVEVDYERPISCDDETCTIVTTVTSKEPFTRLLDLKYEIDEGGPSGENNPTIDPESLDIGDLEPEEEVEVVLTVNFDGKPKPFELFVNVLGRVDDVRPEGGEATVDPDDAEGSHPIDLSSWGYEVLLAVRGKSLILMA